MIETQLDLNNGIVEWDEEYNSFFDFISTIHSNYVALQHGMDIAGIIDSDLRTQIQEYHTRTCALEDFNSIHPAEQYRRFVLATPFDFALEGVFESILDWEPISQALFICLFPGGFIFWCIGMLERIYNDSQAIMQARKKLADDGFYDPGADPKTFSQEELDPKSLSKYQRATIKAYPSKQLLEELEASYTLMRIFSDMATNGVQIKPRQIIPSLHKLGFEVDSTRGKIRRDKSKAAQRGTMQELGCGDPNFIKQIFVKTTPHTDLLPTFIKAMKKIQQEQKDSVSINAKIRRFFHVDDKKDISPKDKAGALLIGEALKVTLKETETLFKMSLSLMAMVQKYE